LCFRWQLGGVEALINDDGRDLDDSLVPKQLHDSVSVNELLDAIEQKYDLLRHKLFSEMILKQIGKNNILLKYSMNLGFLSA
jgi:hypothetical protein